MFAIVNELVSRAADAGLLLCHWKSNIRLPMSVTGKTDLDFFVLPEHEAEVRNLLHDINFVSFRSPIWSRYDGVTDWLGLDVETGSLLHVHLHTRLLTGTKSVKEQDLPWSGILISALVKDIATNVLIPPRGFEFHQLLARESVKFCGLRGLLLRICRGVALRSDEREELRWLEAQCLMGEIDYWGERLWGDKRWQRLQALLVRLDHDKSKFQRVAFEINKSLAPWRKGTFVVNGLRFIAMRLLLFVSVRLRGVVPQKRLNMTRAPIIAFIGSDGSGKSTIVADTQNWLGWKAEAVSVYLGSKKGWYQSLRRSVAVALRQRKLEVVVNVRSGNESELPPFLKALQGVLFAFVRLQQQRRAWSAACRGTIVLADRWPQAEHPGLCDGPSTYPSFSPSWLSRILQKYESKLIKKQSIIKPDLIIKLKVPLAVALARKPDHPAGVISQKINIIQSLKFDGVEVIEVDSAQPLDDVRRIVRQQLWTKLHEFTKKTNAIY